MGNTQLAGSHLLSRGEVVSFGRSTVGFWTGPTNVRPTTGDDTSMSIERLEAIIATDPPDLTRLRSAATSVTTVVLDIHDSDRKAADMATDRWSAVVEAHSSIVRRHSIRARGLELVCCGDAFLIAFASALQAVTCMVDVQRTAHALARSRPADTIQVRSGVHTSDVVVRTDPHLLGQHVTVAAALAKAARGSEILVTGIVRELVELHGSTEFDTPRRLSSRSSSNVRLAHPLRWERDLTLDHTARSGAPHPT